MVQVVESLGQVTDTFVNEQAVAVASACTTDDKHAVLKYLGETVVSNSNGTIISAVMSFNEKCSEA
jgi:hypothetical protein